MDATTIGRGAGAAAVLCLVMGQARADPAADSRYRAVIERPLFSPTRRPPPPAPEPAEAAPLTVPPPPAPDVVLSGIIAGGGGGGVALLKRPLDAAPLRLARGAQIDGWTLSEIRPRSVVLRRDARSVAVELPAAR